MSQMWNRGSQVTRCLFMGAVLGSVLAGCWAKTNVTLVDKGAPEADPYDHHQSPVFSEGRISGFRTIYVDAEAFAAKLTPSQPLQQGDKPKKISAEDWTPALSIELDLEKTREAGLEPADTLTALRTMLDPAPKLAWLPMSRRILLPLTDSADVDALNKMLAGLSVGESKLADLASIEAIEDLPAKAVGMVQVNSGPNVDGVTTWGPAPKQMPQPKNGTLAIDNISSAWAEVTVNGTKVGVIPPLAHGAIHDVKPGVYQVSYEQPTGRVWTESIEALPKRRR